MKLSSRYFNRHSFNLRKIYSTFLFSTFFPIFFILTGVLVSGVYPAYAFERSIFNIVITSDNFPIVWRKDFAKDLETQLDSQQLLTLNICNADANCSQAAVNAGAVYFKNITGAQGVIAYYDENGKLVGTSEANESPVSGAAPTPPGSSSGSNSSVSQVVGSLSGELVISQTGAANYTIPIEIPPSTKGVSPNLAFSYNSQSGNGFLGMGWAIAGIPEITRCGANLAIEGYIRPVKLTYADRFCMGGQRLIAVNGAYGANGTEYRTEIDSSQKITSRGTAGFGPAWFEVETKSGGMMVLGYQEGEYDSRFEANAGEIIRLPTIEKWAIGKVQDKDGNYYKVAYEEDSELGGRLLGGLFIRPSSNHILKIDYTGNDAMGIAPYASVQFEYENRTDSINYWVAGSRFSLNERLSRVKTFVGDTQVKEYRLKYSYEPVTKNSRLLSLQECSGSECKNPTTFTWSNGNKQLKSTTWEGSITSFNFTRVGDFNGDGKDDLIQPSASGGAFVKLSKGNGFNVANWKTVENYWPPGKTWIGDFDGNGMSDIASVTSGNVHMHLSKGSSFTNKIWLLRGTLSNSGYIWTGDFNGDNLTDIASASGSSVYMMLSTGSSFASTNFRWAVPGTWGGADYTWTGDFNGDGLTDIASASGGNIYMHLSTGRSFSSSTWTGPDTWGSADYTWTGDFNGDGKTDIASASGANLYFRISTGKGFVFYSRKVPYGWGHPIKLG